MALSYRLSPFRGIAAVHAPSRRDRRHDGTRIDSIDVLRGAAMVFVCLSHFATGYLYQNGRLSSAYLLSVVSMVASPSFMLVSGMVAGFLVAVAPWRFPQIRHHLVDRGVFLLVAGHFVLAVATLRHFHDLWAAYTTGYITDVIGLALIAGPPLARELSPRNRAALAVALFGTSWIVSTTWHPTTSGASWIQHYLFGVPGARATFPLLPWFAVYVLGTLLGERFGASYRTGDRKAARGVLLRVGCASVAASLGAFAAVRFLATFGVAALSLPTIVRITSPTQKYPPGPVYLLLFGGAALIMGWCAIELNERRDVTGAVEFLKHLGQASLFVYFLQAFTYNGIKHAGLRYTPFWPLLFAGTLLLFGLAARAWCYIDGNRFFTVGLRAWGDSAARFVNAEASPARRTS
ncbi:MAG TPA: heparan-alpha-glucosaminide N-acetyltransferase domain-containing protein [Gemmatimonadaceae bacterium]|jgi:uncharacterized membrane protein|nr:heparan-alpha-glucosaminide N-acetyltransferase domain-containing protein [Gemmatimonadaceae bacterium]